MELYRREYELQVGHIEEINQQVALLRQTQHLYGAFLGFCVSLGSAETLVRWCGKTNHCSIAYTLDSISHPFNGPFSGTTQVSRYQKGKTNLDFTEARDSEWQWHQLDHMQVCTSIQTDNHASTPPLKFLQAGCPSCHPTNSVKALKAYSRQYLCHKLLKSVDVRRQAMRLLSTWHARLQTAAGGRWRSTVWENIEQSATHTVPATSTTIYSITEL